MIRNSLLGAIGVLSLGPPIVMLRDLGSKRVPPFIMLLATGTIFFVTCYVLHQRDKEIMRARAAAAAS